MAVNPRVLRSSATESRALVHEYHMAITVVAGRAGATGLFAGAQTPLTGIGK
jgi:hypothetical protein